MTTVLEMKMTTKMEMNIPLLSMKREIQTRKPRSVRFLDPLAEYVKPKIFEFFYFNLSYNKPNYFLVNVTDSGKMLST